jgi:signal transduction histidine kinase
VGSPGPRPDSAAPSEILRSLQAVTDAALAHLSLDELLDELLNRVREALRADTCAVLLLDETRTELVARAAKGLEEEVEEGVRVPVGHGFAGKIVAEQRSVVIEDLDRAEVVNPILRRRGIKSLAGVPLLVDDRVLGVIHVGTLSRREFAAAEIDLLHVVAQRVALAIDHALVYDELLHVTHVQRDFIELAAHELRGPASSIYGLAATLRGRRAELSAERAEELLETLYQQSDRLRRLVEQLLDLSQLEATTVEIRPKRLRLRPELEEIVGAVTTEATEEVVVEVPADLEAEVDPSALERVVGNLVANALRHGSPPVTVSAEQRDRHLRIAVEDRGHGVADEFAPFLFDRFRRSERSLTTGEGAGLGLAIARSYARAHGGELIYGAAEPTGARFEFVLPSSANG